MGELGLSGGAVALFQQLRGAAGGDDSVGAGGEQAAGADELAGGGFAEEDAGSCKSSLTLRNAQWVCRFLTQSILNYQDSL